MAVPGIGDRLEGVHSVMAALAAGRVMSLTVERKRLDSPEFVELVATSKKQGVPLSTVADVRPMAVTSAPQGVLAAARPIRPVSIRELLKDDPAAAVVVLDHVLDPRNVGAIARSAVAAGFTGLVIAGRRAAPLGATAFKAAVGALEVIPLTVVTSTAATIRRLRSEGVWTVALSGTGEESLFDVKVLDQPIAIVVGGEGDGVGRLAGARCDVVARIPMAVGVESLNVSVAAAVAAFEIGRARGRLV